MQVRDAEAGWRSVLVSLVCRDLRLGFVRADAEKGLVWGWVLCFIKEMLGEGGVEKGVVGRLYGMSVLRGSSRL